MNSFDSEEAEGLAEVFSFTRKPILTRHTIKTNSLACCGRVNQVLQRVTIEIRPAGVLRYTPAFAPGASAGRPDEYLADIFIAIGKLGLPSEPMTVK